MNEPKRSFDEKAKAIAGMLAVISGVVTTATQFSKDIREFLGLIPELGPIWYPVLVALIIAGAWAIWDGLARRSRLLRPEALLLRADRTEHLAGRSEDIDRLSRLCTDYSQVHLVGESGAGKSALARAGLCPKLGARARLIPVYVDVWGQDWETGPRVALASALWQALSQEDRDAIGLTGPPEPKDLLATIRRSKVKLGREPLLIFDQFDDYQTRHRSRFLPGRRRTWLPANKLIKVNSFWRDIANLVGEEGVHCLFVTRTDTADGLESIRFVSPQVYRLDRLNVDSVQPLLTHLTPDTEGSDPVVFAPDHGWDRLKDRLARDLGKDGAVLPAQMKIALQGLAGLGALTVRDYERKGGLRGLEAAHIQRHVSGTARNFNLTKSQVRTLLLSMVDPEALKTVPRSTDDLQEVVIGGDKRGSGRLKQTVQVVLDYLEQREIIRRRLDPDTHQHVWVLDHDYLCRGVLEAEHGASRWFVMALESQRAFREAGSGIWRKWKSLLDPWPQVVLACLRLVGRFRYGDMRSFAALSLLRFVPLVILGSAMAFYFLKAEDKQRKRVDQAWEIIASAQGRPGDLGRKDALLYLHRNGKSFEKVDISLAYLPRLSLTGANLKHANLAKIVLAGADLSGADLTLADLSDANMCDANFSGAELSDANLPQSTLWFADFSDANLRRANLLEADLSDANLAEAVLVYANCTRADFTSAYLSKAKLIGANLAGADLTDAKLIDADLTDANLAEASLKGANLSGADLTRANLAGAMLWGKADLTEAKLIDANLAEANLAEADLAKANLRGANLFGAYLADANLTDISGWREIKSLEYVNIYGVKNAPKEFEEQATAPEQRIESYIEWRDWKRQKIQKATSGK